MRYLSTRHRPGDQPLRFSDILLEGLAPDGGLYVPAEGPLVDAATLAAWRDVLRKDGYAGLAHAVLRLFIDDIPSDDLRRLCERAYNGEVFATPDVVPVSRLSEGLWIAHLSDGPSAAFKDLAMQLLGQFFEYELERRGTELNILGATSGDTGSAAEYAMLTRERIRVFMLTPAGRMTPFQQAQMYSIDDPSIVNLAVDGVFDDCQDLVKAVFADLDFKRRHRLGAVNSINWARLAAQIVYYVASWLRVTTRDDQLVSFCVPSGNFGNICAAHFARSMGVPIADLVLATNENNVLEEFFRTGVYRVRGASETHATSSPSMDISKASNFERFVYDLFGGDAGRVRELFGRQLATRGFFDVSETSEFAALFPPAEAPGDDASRWRDQMRDRYGFASGTSTHADRVAAIASVWASDGVMIDPHTADGVAVARRFVRPDVPMIVTETALPVKFSATIVEATGREPDRPERFAGIEDLPRHVLPFSGDAEALKALIAARVEAG